MTIFDLIESSNCTKNEAEQLIERLAFLRMQETLKLKGRLVVCKSKAKQAEVRE